MKKLLLVDVTAVVIDTEVDGSVAAVVGLLEVSTTVGKIMLMKTMQLITSATIIV